MTGLVATAETDIRATPEQVWRALTDPKKIEKYMFGSQVQTDWRPGSPITWKGEYEGKQFEDKGEILECEPGQVLQMTHFSPLTGQEDAPENYHTVTYRLSELDGGTHVTVSQDNNSTMDELRHSTTNWQSMLDGLKKVVESR